MAQYFWQTQMSKAPNALDYLKKKEQEKKKFNLFDFSDVTPKPQLNFWPWMSWPWITNFQDFKANIPQQAPQTQPTQKSGFSLIPKANFDIQQQAMSDIQAGMPIEEFETYYPELYWMKQVFTEYANDIKAGMPQEEASKYYPELFWQTQPTQEKWYFWYALEDVKSTPEAFKWLAERTKERFWKSSEIMQDEWIISWSIAWWLAWLWTAWDTAFTSWLQLLKIISPESVDEAVAWWIEKIAPTLQKLWDKIETFKQSSPEAKRLVDKTSLLLEWYTPIKWWQIAGQVARKTAPVLKQWAEKTWEVLTKWGKQVIDTTSKAKQSLKATKEQVTSWLTKEQIKGFQSNPYQADEFKKLTERLESPEWISDIKDYKVERVWAITQELTDEIDKIRATKWETSKVYKDIRQLPVKVKTDELLKNFETTLKSNWMDLQDWVIVRVPGSKAKDLNQADLTKFNQLYNDIIADSSKWYLTPDEVLTFRKTVSDLAKYDSATTTTWQWILGWIRKDIDNTAKAQIPWLKELDSQFVDKLDELENAIRDLVYKWWDVKWEWRSNIVNIVWTLDRANRAKLLARLDEVMPWVWEKIQAIDNLTTIMKSLESKWIFEKYTWFWWAVAWATALWTALPVIWHIAWAIVWLTWWKLLEAGLTGIRKVALNKVLSKISKEWLERLKEINSKIEKKQLLKESDKNFIENLKKQFKNEINKSKDNNLKSTIIKPMTSLTDNTTSNISPKKLSFKEITWKEKVTPLKPSILSDREKKLLKPNQPTNVSNKTIKKPSETWRKVLKKILPSNFKEKAQDFIEWVAEKTWWKTNLLPTNSKQVSKVSDDLKPITKLNTWEKIVLVRWEQEWWKTMWYWIKWEWQYLTDNIDVAKHYWWNLKYVSIKNSKILDWDKIITKNYVREITKELPNNIKRNFWEYDIENMDYTYNSLIRDLSANSWIDEAIVSNEINKILKNKYNWIKYKIWDVNDALYEKWLWDKNAFIIFPQINKPKLLKRQSLK